jgi:radical SAM superfamily enzyme YgiQ (UPF0313 family)
MPPGIAGSWQPHLGMSILAARLKKGGFSPVVVDYSYSQGLPEIERFLEAFEPEVIGVSLLSQHIHASERFIGKMHRSRPAAPIMVGGPHVSITVEECVERVRRLPGIRTVVKGEADLDIVEITKHTLSDASPRTFSCGTVELDDYCWPDFDLVIEGSLLQTYPIQLSRGCPFRCVFCNIANLSGRKFRTRKIDDCIDEIEAAVGRYKRLGYVKVTDDAPNSLPERFEAFLEAYVDKGFRPRLEIMQLRADKLTLAMCRLLKKARTTIICLGVESADPEVFTAVKKGETLAQIERACGFVKSCDIPLVLCFVLGLPGATWKSDLASIAFARRMGPVHCYWNLAQPMPGTEMYDYFSRHGKIYSENTFAESSLEGGCFADTPEYSREERLRLQIIAQATTNELSIGSVADILRRAGVHGALVKAMPALLANRPRIPKQTPRRW